MLNADGRVCLQARQVFIDVGWAIMIWIFERGDQAVRVETRFDKDAAEYIATIAWADGKIDVERFVDHEAFQARLVELERTLLSDRWQQVGGPTLIRKDWWQGSSTES